MLCIRDLSVRFSSTGDIYAIQGLDMDVQAGKNTVLLGETGSGKSVLLLSILRLLPGTAAIEGGIVFDGRNLLALSQKEMTAVRGAEIAYVPQGGGSSMNPLMKTGYQVGEPLMEHRNYRKKDAVRKSISLLRRFQLGREEQLIHAFPHTLSGGMRQRVLIAMGIAAGASLILADEPTKGLDDERIQTVIDCFLGLAGKTLLCVSHDIAFARKIADKVCVMYASRAVEQSDGDKFFDEPLHPYSKALLLAQTQLRCEIGFAPPKMAPGDCGCLFYPYCANRMGRCLEPPPMISTNGRKVMCWLYAD